MPRLGQLTGLLVVTAYAAILLVPCAGMARPLGETRITLYCECPAHAAHGSASSFSLELARLPAAPAPLPRQPLWTRCADWQPTPPLEPPLERDPPVPRA